jgi:hypothetical protein
MHGVALTIIFDKQSRDFMSTRAQNKNIDNIDRNKQVSWNTLEQLTMIERM